MKVEIWSDVMCPFCYIGKRKFEAALAQFPQKEKVEIEWKSFQLNPAMKTEPSKNINQYLAEIKGWSMEQAEQMNARVTQMAADVGLTYHFDKAIVANSFDAHRLSHLAKEIGLQDELEERLFAAYFTEGKNTAAHETLIQIGKEIGLDETKIKQLLQSDLYAEAVRADAVEAQQLGVRGVPFFVMDRNFAVSGAQDTSVFLQTLQQSWDGFSKENLTTDGEVCTPESC